MSRFIGLLFILSALCLIGWTIFTGVRMDYQWDRDFASPWELSDKSSTLSEKAKYIDSFVANLENGIDRDDYNALYFKTPTNNCGKNLDAVASLATRLHALEEADPESMAYQQAIQQITAQEQGEASALIHEVKGCWMKHSHPWFWNPWLNLLYAVIVLFFGIIGIAILASDDLY